MTPRAPAFGTALLLGLTLSGCHRPVETRIEKVIADRLPRYLGEADSYDVHVAGRADAIYRGRLRSVHIEGVNVRLVPDLVVSRLVIDVKDVSVDKGSGTLQNIGETRFSARLTEGAITHYVASRPNAPRDFALSLGGDGKATVTTRPELLGFPTLPVSLRGTVRLQSDGTHLDFAPDKALLDTGIGTVGTRLPGFVADHIAAKVNPVADLSRARFPVVADSVTIENGAATVTGRVPAGELQRLIAGAGGR